MRSMIVSRSSQRDVRAGQSSGRGTCGGVSHSPLPAMGRWPSAAFTVRISRSATCATTRAWVVKCPDVATVTSTSITSSTIAYDRYCPVAHTTGRPDTASSATIAAASPHPPKRNLPAVAIPDVTGSTQR